MAPSRPLDLVLAHADRAKREGRGWMAICPAHRDVVPSLHITEADDGRVLLKCHAGCSTDVVVAMWGMELSALFPPPIRSNGQPHIAATYNYRDEQGEVLYQVVKYDPKSFRQRRPDGKGGWTWNLNGTRRLLYGLPELLSSSNAPVVLVEGEKDADRLTGLGFTATTAPSGAGKWRLEYGESLRGRRVIVLPDNDEPGRQDAEQKVAALRGVAAHVQVINLEGLPAHGDVSNWLDAGHSGDELRALLQSPPQAPPAFGDEIEAIFGPISPAPIRRIEVTWMNNIERKRVDYIWRKRIARGKLTAIGGDPGVGKGTIGIDIAARISTQAAWPDGDCAPLGRTMLLTGEDDPSDTIGPRLDAAGADSSRIAVVGRVLEISGENRRLNLHDDIESLLEQAHGDEVNVLIIDPLSSYLGDGINSWRDSDMRPLLDRLSEAASRYGIAVIAVVHLNKNSGGKAMYRFGGSIASVAAARFGFLIAPDPHDSEIRVMASIKANLVSKPTSLAFRIVGKHHPEVGEEIGCIEWIGASPLTADELLVDAAKSSNALDRAVGFLSDYLSAGPAYSRDIEAAAEKKGVGVRHALWDAKKELGIVARKDGLGGWKWFLPGAAVPQEEVRL